MKLTVATILLLLVATVALADTFDTPRATKVVDYGVPADFRSQPNDNRLPYARRPPHDKLRCFYYPEFMVKQYENQWIKGAYWLAIVPSEKGIAPTCTRAHGAGERVIRGKEWWGYFKGAKGRLVFFDLADGTSGGLPFAIYDFRTGKRVFEDSTVLGLRLPKAPLDDIQFSVAADKGITLTYLRVVEAGCDLHRENAACWDKLRKRLGLKVSQVPKCGGYEDVKGTGLPSVVAYPVEVTLFPQPIMKTVPGPVQCWPVD